MSNLSRLKAAGCRVDGLNFNGDGSLSFVSTNAGGAWTTAQQNAVLQALGKAPLTFTAAQEEGSFAAAIQAWLDATAQANGYNNLAYAVSYATSSVALWAKQGATFAAWRDQVWQSAFNLLAEVQAGTQPVPASAGALIALLPQPNIPTS